MEDSTDLSAIFSPENNARLKAAERRINDALLILERCEACDFDVSSARELRDHLSERIRKVRQEFFASKGL